MKYIVSTAEVAIRHPQEGKTAEELFESAISSDRGNPGYGNSERFDDHESAVRYAQSVIDAYTDRDQVSERLIIVSAAIDAYDEEEDEYSDDTEYFYPAL